jgi:hypothetical protein
MIEQGIVDMLRNDHGLRELVGDSVYLVEIPQTHQFAKDGAAISVGSTGGEPTTNAGGESGLSEESFDIECWAGTADVMHKVADGVRLAFARNKRTTLSGGVGVAWGEVRRGPRLTELLNPRGTQRAQGRMLTVDAYYQEHTK